MYLSPYISALCFCLSAFAQTSSANTTYLTVPALVTTPQNTTAIQCWRLKHSPFAVTSQAGITGSRVATVSNATNVAYVIQPPRFNGGLHRAPVPQLVHFIAGLAHVTLPQDSSQELWLVGGRGGLVIAADTTGEGHITMYPSDQETVTITAPFAGGVVPEYEVLKEGPCDGLQTFI
ncbi:34-dihydroxy-2-butanone 4-phosphate synthase protein [Pyrenophora tritici-repentis]|uniref:34-dihydroxy-2-butanone 4-phosphate synthase n=1 Tax=Pyrenophora tritici-repentis TaxID=45151 RepID=A0A2W1GXV1_9PLEO|nr:34-dihydroxy-2-butanone 4-phosphate synthase [Pyrenophora tritici-repentis]KAF7452975.1 34-dihydroxy-2-butanone 4-phosphate synthase [Pyrenophora tritici-repentis]KAF7576022.1 hypothetical protein PtrM4_002620 [Pyrenophora tritici-repentis]KAG9377574.1 hypothetical protein A1F94_011977 [Pyrenophora tritici-repentis]KAI0579819.1 34-dihydroxy-2-butanone 4-phosphate synthase [Pyrenophora tritici-repentis]